MEFSNYSKIRLQLFPVSKLGHEGLVELTEQADSEWKNFSLFIFDTQVLIFSSDIVIQLHELNSLDKWYITLWQYMKDSFYQLLFIPRIWSPKSYTSCSSLNDKLFKREERFQMMYKYL